MQLIERFEANLTASSRSRPIPRSHTNTDSTPPPYINPHPPLIAPAATLAMASPRYETTAPLPHLVILFLLLLLTRSVADAVGYFDAIYSFGDSLADTGNLVREGADGSLLAISQFPYGISPPFHRPTGRSSDGLLMIDYFAMHLGLPLVPPYLDRDANFDHGVNFAVAGATALEPSFFVGKGFPPPTTNSSLDVQLEWFREHVRSTCASESECSKRLEKALFFVGEIGGNDNYLALTSGKTVEEVRSYTPLIVGKITRAIEEVIRAGARHVIVPGNLAVGCMPCLLTPLASEDSMDYDKHRCLKRINSLVEYQHHYLQEALEGVRKKHPHATVVYADYYNADTFLFDKATSLGFDSSSSLKACCGVGGKYNYDADRTCGAPGTSMCQFPSERVSWDGMHHTQAAYEVMAKKLISEGLLAPLLMTVEKGSDGFVSMV